MKVHPPRLLLVDDDVNDVLFLQRALLKAGAPRPLPAVRNGEEAIAYLRGEGEYADRSAFPFPRLIITDLKMPQFDGFQLLEWLRADPRGRLVPAVVFTASTSQADIAACYRLGAATYLIKPVEFADLQRAVQRLIDYWSLAATVQTDP